MAKSRGLTISAKMILTSLAIIILIIILFGYLNYRNIEKAYTDSARRESTTYMKSIRDAASSQIIAFAEPSKSAMQEEKWTDIRTYVPPIRKRDKRILYIWVINREGKFVASADEQDNKKLGEKIAPDFLADPVHKKLADPKLLPKDAAGQVKPFRMEGTVKSLHGQRVLVFGERLVDQKIYVGSVVLVYSLRHLDEQIRKLDRDRKRATRKAFMWTAIIGGLFIVLGALLSVIQGLGVSRPIKVLANRASQIAQGDLETRVDLSSGGELRLLAENFNFMADQLVVLLHETAAKATMTKELEVARDIQQTLVPGDTPVDRGVIQLAGFFDPATECGGDWWTYHDLDDGKLLVVIGDVTGHGVPSAMITATAKSAVDTLRSVTDNKLTVTYLLEILNKAIYESARRQFVMTCFATIVDTRKMTITFANAGHNFPYLYREENGRGKFGVLMTRGNRLGDIVDSSYEPKEQPIRPGDILVWYTDGIVECESEGGEEYGEKRFRTSIRRAKEMPVHRMRERIVGNAYEFYGNMPRKDDITLIFGRVYAQGEGPRLPMEPEGGAEAIEVEVEAPAPEGAQT
jgi:serine phosphatase RsbU (regulator of sigma subunit)